MLSFPLIGRELLAQARNRATYSARIGWGLAAIGVLAFFALTFPEHTINGRALLGVVHGCLAVMLLFLAPITVADTISREKRDGTLGLLLLTPLTPRQVVVGKLVSHCLRLFYSALMMLPFLMLPMLMGGVALREFLFCVSILVAQSIIGLGAGLIASAFATSFAAAITWSMCLAISFSLLFSAGATNFIYSFSPPGFGGSVPWGIRIFLFGPGTLLVPVQALEILNSIMGGRILTTWPIKPAIALQTALLLLSLLLLLFSFAFAARKVARHACSGRETKRQEIIRKKFLTPVWRGPFRRSMSRKLDRNPFIWLENRATWARAARWLMLLIVLALETFFVTVMPSRHEFIGNHFFIFAVLAIFMTFKSASSFQREKECGAFELLLVTPLDEQAIFRGRLRAVWAYYLPTLATVFTLGLWGLTWTQNFFYAEPTELGAAVNFLSLFLSFVTIPVCGLCFALRSKSFLGSLVATGGLGLIAPICIWFASNGLLWMGKTRGMRLPAQIYDFINELWWPALLAVVAYHFLVTSLSARATLSMLRGRRFVSH